MGILQKQLPRSINRGIMNNKLMFLREKVENK